MHESSCLCLQYSLFCILQDLYWNKILWHCSDNNSYQGCTLPRRQEIIDKDPVQLSSSYEGENPEPSNEVEWAQKPFQAEDIPKPVTDESEWADGWKD